MPAGIRASLWTHRKKKTQIHRWSDRLGGWNSHLDVFKVHFTMPIFWLTKIDETLKCKGCPNSGLTDGQT